MEAQSKTVRVVILEEDGLPHIIPDVTVFKVFVMRQKTGEERTIRSRSFLKSHLTENLSGLSKRSLTWLLRKEIPC